ncbi:MAG: polysaccharide biosynthesis protein, partial [Thermoguttaceae bacterium]|nr:polysaccharide biosynthesis protein [Thermoguttaceae bacterium]
MTSNKLSERSDAVNAGKTTGSQWKKIVSFYAQSIVRNVALFALAYWGAFAIRTDFFTSEQADFLTGVFWRTSWMMIGIKLIIVYSGNQYRNIGLFATMRELYSIIVGASVAFVFAVFLLRVAPAMLERPLYQVPVSVLLIDFTLSVIFRGGVRIARRFFHESVLQNLEAKPGEELALLIGANDRGAHIANNINTQRNSGHRVVGFLTVHETKVKFFNASLPIVAHIDDVVFAAKRMNVSTILTPVGLLPGRKFREIYDKCDANGLKCKTIPQVEFAANTKIPMNEISVEDLLKRDPIVLDTKQIGELVAGRRAIVTGAGGSIGSEICRQLVKFAPKELFILGRGENRIFFLEKELNELCGKTVKITPIIADVTNAPRMDLLFSTYRPEIVFHAAAHKHVPL